MTTEQHSILPPSSAARRVACPGSRALEAAYPELEESQEAREGRAAHWVAAEYLEGRTVAVGLLAPNNEIVTHDMIEGAEMYSKDVDLWRNSKYQLGALFVEKKIEIPSIHKDCWGTPDAWGWSAPHNEFFIWDYKFGHDFVEVYGNWQLIEYAAGILHSLNINGSQSQHTYVTMCIIQPRCFSRGEKVRKWRVSVNELRGYFNMLEAAEHKAMQPEALCTPNPECNYCSARHVCSALQHAASTAITVSMQNVPHQLTPQQTGHELYRLEQAAKRIEARITGLKAQAVSQIERGERVPHYTLGVKSARQVWTIPVNEVKMLGMMCGAIVTKPEELVTPKQAITAGIPAAMVNKNSQVVPGSVQLVETDAREAAKAFA